MKKLARRRIAGLVTVGMLVGAIAVSAAPAFATHVEPTFVEGNPSCPSGTTELTKVEPVVSGSMNVTHNGDNYMLTWTVDAPYISFSTTNGLLIQAVIVKGGDNANLYDYRSLGGATSDSGLHAPLNQSNDKYYGLSHVSFCWDTTQVTTTTSSSTTSSSTSSSSSSSSTSSSTSSSSSSTSSSTTSSSTTSSSTTSSSTTSSTSTTVAPTTSSTTSTTVAPTTTSTTSTTVAPSSTTTTTKPSVSPTTVSNTVDTLPFTGLESGDLAVVSLVAMVMGAGILYLTRDGESAAHLDRS